MQAEFDILIEVFVVGLHRLQLSSNGSFVTDGAQVDPGVSEFPIGHQQLSHFATRVDQSRFQRGLRFVGQRFRNRRCEQGQSQPSSQ